MTLGHTARDTIACPETVYDSLGNTKPRALLPGKKLQHSDDYQCLFSNQMMASLHFDTIFLLSFDVGIVMVL